MSGHLVRTLLGSVVGVTLIVLSTVEGTSQTANQSGITEPLVLDVAGNGVGFTPPGMGVSFALNGPRQPVHTAWTLPDSDDAFLALETDHNGNISSGLELIGGASPGPDGFATLNYYDGVTNMRRPADGRKPQDGRIDTNDAVFNDLILWTDRNHNGTSEEDELAGLSYSGVIEILVGYMGLDRTLPNGSIATFEGNVLMRNKAGVQAYRKIYAIRPVVEP